MTMATDNSCVCIAGKKLSTDKIFSKNLFILIPFYIFSYESNFGNIESDIERLQNVQDTYKSIMVRLEEVCLQGKITEYEKQTIIDMSKEVLRNIATKSSRVSLLDFVAMFCY